MAKCLICEKKLETYNEEPVGAILEVNFHPESRHRLATKPMEGYEEDPYLKLLIESEEILCYLCDDCFEKRAGLMEGFQIETRIKRVKV